MPLHLLYGEPLARTTSSHPIAIDGIVGRVLGRGGERTGEVERVMGALTASEFTVETDVWEPVRRRGGEARTVGRLAWVRVTAPMRAASFLKDGSRFAEKGLGASEADCEAADVLVLIASNKYRHTLTLLDSSAY